MVSKIDVVSAPNQVGVVGGHHSSSIVAGRVAGECHFPAAARAVGYEHRTPVISCCVARKSGISDKGNHRAFGSINCTPVDGCSIAEESGSVQC